jgi:hypothetical protein
VLEFKGEGHQHSFEGKGEHLVELKLIVEILVRCLSHYEFHHTKVLSTDIALYPTSSIA